MELKAQDANVVDHIDKKGERIFLMLTDIGLSLWNKMSNKQKDDYVKKTHEIGDDLKKIPKSEFL